MELWQWLLAGVVAWYVVAGVLIRQSTAEFIANDGTHDQTGEYAVRFIAWAASPVIVPTMVLWLAAALVGRYALTPRR